MCLLCRFAHVYRTAFIMWVVTLQTSESSAMVNRKCKLCIAVSLVVGLTDWHKLMLMLIMACKSAFVSIEHDSHSIITYSMRTIVSEPWPTGTSAC